MIGSNRRYISKIHLFKNGGSLILLFILAIFYLCITNAGSVSAIRAPIDSGDYSGLYKTGVTSDGMSKTSVGGRNDNHWTLDRVYNPKQLSTCQSIDVNKMYDYELPLNRKATTLFEKGEANAPIFPGIMNVGVGYDSNNPPVLNIGQKINTYWVWSLVDNGARWIGPNDMGQHLHSRQCPDPSYNNGSASDEFANVFVFKLNNIKINRLNNRTIDFSSLKFFMNVDADNWVKVYANGVQLNYSSSTDPNRIRRDGWIDPDFTDNNTSRFEWGGAGTSAFHYGNDNSIEVHVLSTLTNVGFIATQIGLSGFVDIQDTNNPCRPIIYKIQPKQHNQINIPGSNIVYEGNRSDAVNQTGYGKVNVRINGDLVTGSPFSSIESVGSEGTNTYYITGKYTTGNQYKVVYSETEYHVTGYTIETQDDLTKPIMSNDTSQPQNQDGSYPQKIIGYQQKYKDTLVHSEKKSWTDNANPIGPCYDYVLDTKINNFGSYVESGSSINISPSVISKSFTNKWYSGYLAHSKSKTTNWQVTQMVIAPSSSGASNFPADINNSGYSYSAPCSYFDPLGRSSCTTYALGSKEFSINPETINLPSVKNPFKIPDVPAGTKYCFVSSLFPASSDPLGDQQYVHSSFSYRNNCVIVVKKPKTQVQGGDLVVGRKQSVTDSSTPQGKVATSTSIKLFNSANNKIYGSWAEYGIFASGVVSGMASGSAFMPATGPGFMSSVSSPASKCLYSTLTFANTVSPSKKCTTGVNLGNYKITQLIPNIAASFKPITGSSPTPYIANTSSGSVDFSGKQGLYQVAGGTSINLKNITIQKGQWVVINAQGSTVKISGDINYSGGSFASIDDLPQLIILADNINITDNPTNIDAWLIANKTINTCSPYSAIDKLSVNLCTNKLVVNGPVIASHLLLRRTAGSGPSAQSGDPAEVFNLRPDAYLWAMGRARSTNIIITTYTTELPPRL